MTNKHLAFAVVISDCNNQHQIEFPSLVEDTNWEIKGLQIVNFFTPERQMDRTCEKMDNELY